MWPLTWLNRNVVTINVIFQLLDIYKRFINKKRRRYISIDIDWFFY